ncbi:MAG TPA: diguanylate cyclase [Thiolapillus brandeum]|uniref:diguanylate cyclase n=1 Tax=Thiolapillus brandeum TaxID=1076588 RepID=A0A831K3B8_9GAMM|nr:diguanylate cyclase [Thiolapillus brandeum]
MPSSANHKDGRSSQGKIIDEQHLSLLAKAEALRLLYNQSFPAVFVSLLTALILCAILWPVQQKKLLAGWFIILGLSALARIFLFVRYWRTKPQGNAILGWEKTYFITLMASSLIWGLGVLFILPKDSLEHQIATYFILIGMAGGAISVYSAHRAMTLATTAVITLPITLWAFLQNAMLLKLMAIAAALFMLSIIRSGKVLSSTMMKSFYLTHQLKELNEVAEQLARLDELTGIANRRAFYEQGQMMLKSSHVDRKILALILLDLDFFKKVNDSYGHAAGDHVLKWVGQILRENVRDTDVSARLGGEEFAVLLPISEPIEAVRMAERIRQAITETAFVLDDAKTHVTASLGISWDKPDLDSLFRDADKALYHAKAGGRNQVVSADQVEPQ